MYKKKDGKKLLRQLPGAAFIWTFLAATTNRLEPSISVSQLTVVQRSWRSGPGLAPPLLPTSRYVYSENQHEQAYLLISLDSGRFLEVHQHYP